MPQPVVGLIGCGHIGRFHSRNIRATLQSELVPGQYAAVCDRILDRAESFAGIVGAKVVAGDAEAVFGTPGLNAVYICTETAEHPALVMRAAELGLNIFCEKPLGRSLAEVEPMVAAVQAAGVVNQVGLILRHSPVFTVLKDLISDPNLGPFLTAHLRDDQFFPDHGNYDSNWRADVERAGGGTLIEHSIHDVDLFQWLFGPIQSVKCRLRYTSGHPGVEDVALATFEHAGEVSTSVSSIWHACDDRPSTRRLEIFFEGGYFTTDHDYIGPIRWQGRTGPEQEIGVDEVWERYQALTGQTEAEMDLARRAVTEDYLFLRAVLEGRPAHPDFATALAAHRVVDACYRSARGSQEIEVKNP